MLKLTISAAFILSASFAQANDIKFWQVPQDQLKDYPTASQSVTGDSRYEISIEDTTWYGDSDYASYGNHAIGDARIRHLEIEPKKHTLRILNDTNVVIETQPVTDEELLKFSVFLKATSKECPLLLRLGVKDFKLMEVIYTCRDF